MGFGEPSRGHPKWALGEEASPPVIRHAIEARINFFDTANLYSQGTSEENLGRALKEYTNRDSVVIATNVLQPMRSGPNAGGLSRKAIMTEIDHSLRRLGTDYIDLYQIHRRDPKTPWEETLEALHDLVKMGKVRYLGASSMMAWEFSKALHIQKARNGPTGSGGDLIISAPETGAPSLALTITPMRDAAIYGLAAARTAVIFAQDFSVRLSPRFEERIGALYGLTRKEASLVAGLAAGQSLKDAANERSVTIATARTQLATVFRKTHTSQQSQLVSLVLSVLPVHRWP